MPPRKRAQSGGESAAKRVATEDPQTMLSGGNKAQSKMAQFWREGKFCDVTVRLDGRNYPAHRVVLAAGSEMLAALSDGNRFADSVSPTIELSGMSAAAFEAVLTYLYDGTVTCAASLLMEVGAAASYLQVVPLLDLTSDALKAGLTAANCIRTWAYGKMYSVDGLVAECHRKAVAEFTQLTHAEELPLEEMRSLLASDDLAVECEEQVYDMAVRHARARTQPASASDADAVSWWDSDLAPFFALVRYPLLRAATFDSLVMTEPLLAGVACQQMLARA